MAVYTDVTPEALTSYLARYDIGTVVSFHGIAEGVENSNFLLRTDRADFILTLYEKRMDPKELPWFLGLMRHLAVGGLVCPEPVAARDGSLQGVLAGRPCAITTFLQGMSTRAIATDQCEALGVAMARLHALGAGYAPVRRNALGPDAWGPLLGSCLGAGDTLMAGLTAEVTRAVEEVCAAWPGDLPSGQIHADMFPDNVFFLDGALSGVIDFYFACTDLFAYDLAISLNAWCFDEGGRLDRKLSGALLRGYESVRVLTRAEREALPVLCRGAAIRFLLTRLYDWVNTPADALVTRKDPLPYLARLRCHLGIDEASVYG